MERKIYQIDFGPHVRCSITISNNEIEEIKSIDGWGNVIPLQGIKIKELTKIQTNGEETVNRN